VIQDVLVGEVWLCSGQSNMVMSLKGVRTFKGLDPDSVKAVDADIAAASFGGLIRGVFGAIRGVSTTGGPWKGEVDADRSVKPGGALGCIVLLRSRASPAAQSPDGDDYFGVARNTNRSLHSV